MIPSGAAISYYFKKKCLANFNLTFVWASITIWTTINCKSQVTRKMSADMPYLNLESKNFKTDLCSYFFILLVLYPKMLMVKGPVTKRFWRKKLPKVLDFALCDLKREVNVALDFIMYGPVTR